MIHSLRIKHPGLEKVGAWSCHGEATCTTLSKFGNTPIILVGSLQREVPWLSLYSLDGTELISCPINAENHGKVAPLRMVDIDTPHTDMVRN